MHKNMTSEQLDVFIRKHSASELFNIKMRTVECQDA
jgi:hypothetical protein